MSIATLAKSVPAELKKEVRKGFNKANHAEVYGKLENFLMETHCVYEDGTIYAVAKKIAGAC